MEFKCIVFAALVAIARGGVIGAPAAVVGAPLVAARLSDATVDPNPAYSYAYDVQDALTGDSKSQVESRANGIVRGQYTVADPDGTRRIVDYYADPVHGFNAVVRKTPLAVATPVVAAKTVAAPVVAAKVIAPAAPVLSARAVAPAAPVVSAAPAPLVARSAAAPLVAAAPAPIVSSAPFVARSFAAPLLAGLSFARLASPYFASASAPLALNAGLVSQNLLASSPIFVK